MRFKYKYEHLSCGLCNDIKQHGCPYMVCPHIKDNLDDLRHDPEFNAAVENAESCGNYHRFTLILLKWIDSGMPQKPRKRRAKYTPTIPDDNRARCGFKPECEGCQFPAHGFMCYGAKDGSCLKTDYDAILQKGRAPCPA
jgi:hypothetical protein